MVVDIMFQVIGQLSYLTKNLISKFASESRKIFFLLVAEVSYIVLEAMETKKMTTCV
jgi:hypothetical protein